MTVETDSPILIVDRLSASFPNGDGKLSVLDDLSFEISRSEFVCLLGPSGSGKSTLIRILAGLLGYQKGKVILDGRPLDGPREGVGIVFQSANLMPWRTVRENIQLPLEMAHSLEGAKGQVVQELIDLVGLVGFEDTLPRDLSGGMAQRVASYCTSGTNGEKLSLWSHMILERRCTWLTGCWPFQTGRQRSLLI